MSRFSIAPYMGTQLAFEKRWCFRIVDQFFQRAVAFGEHGRSAFTYSDSIATARSYNLAECNVSPHNFNGTFLATLEVKGEGGVGKDWQLRGILMMGVTD